MSTHDAVMSIIITAVISRIFGLKKVSLQLVHVLEIHALDVIDQPAQIHVELYSFKYVMLAISPLTALA